MSVPLGQPETITFKTYSDANRTTLADPTTATVYVKDPTTGVVASHVWPTGDLTKASTGTFTYTLPNSVAGLWQWRAAATGAVATSTRAGAVSVDEAFPAMLVGLEDVKAETNIDDTTDDDELTTTIYTASALLLNHPDYRVSDVCSVQTYTEDFTKGGDTILLQHYPVTAVTSVTEYVGGVGTVLAAEPINTAAFTGYGYQLDAASGILTRLSGGYATCVLGNVRVVYTAGSASVPQDVRDAALNLVRHLWETQRGAVSPALPLDQEFDTNVVGVAGYLLPNRVTEALSAYRRTPLVA